MTRSGEKEKKRGDNSHASFLAVKEIIKETEARKNVVGGVWLRGRLLIKLRRLVASRQSEGEGEDNF